MAGRTGLRGNAMPGGRIEYPGDSTPPVTSYAYPLRHSSIGQRLAVPASTVVTKSAVVRRGERRGGIRSFYSYGAMPMPVPLPGPPGFGGVIRSYFQRFNNLLIDWQFNPSWNEAGYPQNLKLSTRVPQLQTNTTGAPGRSLQTQRPLFTRVQVVDRATARVGTYNTRSGS